ncbi:DUF6770 family protein [Chitinophaga nivalis]|uniref:Uncharacterized protein n=1 Tax=Chitinophaga nivalis TaxID=2991709 RepID=A0ABT3IR76_9BACT|nr:DUF6770 family protein [Chitinophaga nivalis]MCW3463929.1 hypothetical protein [Chitinophaga nivalis]MCW3486381.1 hypothetical protein [Chitinophaga nivalis]
MKRFIIASLLLPLSVAVHAQSKVFKQVGAQISSKIKTIYQNNSLVGYLVFTELEKASKDSFNYRITMMDENLNDIGVVNFRDTKLNLRSVTAEENVLALAYTKSNLIGSGLAHRGEVNRAMPTAYLAIQTQFISLEGKIINSHFRKLSVRVREIFEQDKFELGRAGLKHDLRIQNVSGLGFVAFYGDDKSNHLLVFDKNGKLTLEKNVEERPQEFSMLTSGHDVYFLMKQREKMQEGGYEVIGYHLDNGVVIPKYALKTPKGESLKVANFENDPVTGKPYLSGSIINPRRGHKYATFAKLTKGPFIGMFNVSLEGYQKKDIKASYNYWNTGDSKVATTNGQLLANGYYGVYGPSFRDYYGNTYFAGSAVRRFISPGGLLPMLLFQGAIHRFQVRDVMVLKQNVKGELSYEKEIAVKHGRTMSGPGMYLYDQKSFFTVNAPETKSVYLVISDLKNVHIYDVNKKQVTRSFPLVKDGVETHVFPAKDGYIMISQYDRKEEAVRYSIEAV